METTQEAVLVTGGASGIGLAVVRGCWMPDAGCWRPTFRRSGWTSWATSRRPRGWGACAWMCRTKRRSWMLARQESAFGPIGGLVNSAGIGQDLPFLDTETAALRRMLEVNLVGSFVVAREVARMRKRDMAPSSTSPRCRAYAAMPDARPTARPRAGGDADARDGGRTG